MTVWNRAHLTRLTALSGSWSPRKGVPDNESALVQKLLWTFVELCEAADAFEKSEDCKPSARS